MKYVFRGFLILLVCGIFAALWIWREASLFLNTPPESDGRQIYFDVPPGAAFSDVACDLASKGLITDARKFSWLARLKKQDGYLQAGRFELNSGWGPEKTLEALVKGRPVLYRVTIPEGLTWWQTGKLLEQAGLVRFDDFRDVIMDPEFLLHYGIPFATAEGFLMPDTYLLRKPLSAMPGSSRAASEDNEEEARVRQEWKTQAREVAGRMVDNFWSKSAPVWRNREKTDNLNDTPETRKKTEKLPPPKIADLKRWVILASIVEKETGLENERSRVAGVYANRLKKNMLLQADPTVIYGLGESFSGRLRKVQLEDESNPYNTYRQAGLPPGPICSFGVSALKAAINPEKHDFLYFVAIADSNGGHRFSRTYDEHSRAVNEYIRRRGR